MRELSLRLLLAFILCIFFGVAFGYIASAISNQSIAHFDTAIIGVVQGWETPWMTTVMKVFTWIGSGYVVAPIAVIGFIVLFFVLRYRQRAFLLLITIAGSVIFNSILKIYFKRERPEIHRIMNANGFSFPSGHSMMAFALYTIIAFIAWRNVKTTANRVVLLLFTAFMILIIGTSRIYLGVHYPSDVVGGYVASGLWVTIAIVTYTFYATKKRGRK